MASVLFIIRVPYEENSQSMENDWNGESTSSQMDDENLNQSKAKSDDKALHSEHDRGGGTNEADQNANDVQSLIDPLNLARVLANELRSLNVQGDSWTVTNDKKFHQVAFLEKTVERVETILERLTIVGIGKRSRSSVSIIPTSVHIQPKENVTWNDPEMDSNFTTVATSDAENQRLIVVASKKDKKGVKKKKRRKKEKKRQNKNTKDEFKKSIKSRLTVEQVAEGLRLQARITFDFVMFTVLASFITAVGLAEDSAVVLSASILVSPLMGPILGGTFGLVIKNKDLRNIGLKTEICGLIISAGVGFLFGFICGPFGASWNSERGMWPTQEMISRSKCRSLWVGVLISLPSGAGVALSVLGGTTGSLVGVAVSASLLSPTVNSGMLLAYSIVSVIKPPELLNSSGHNDTTQMEKNCINVNSKKEYKETLTLNYLKSKCPPFKDNSYKAIYSCDMGKEAAILATISLVLTIVNIVCILITATIVLKIKEVTPKASSSSATETFWTKDIKIGRDAYKTFKGSKAENLLKQWEEFQLNKKEAGSQKSIVKGSSELVNMIKQVEETENYQEVVRRAPRGDQNLYRVSRIIQRLISKEDGKDIEDNDAISLENYLKTCHAHYTQQAMKKSKHPHVSKIFSKPEPKQESTPENKQKTREFHVVDTENPHYKSIVRVRYSDTESDTCSVTTETGV